MKRFMLYLVLILFILPLWGIDVAYAQDNGNCDAIINLETPQVIQDDAFYEAQVATYTDALAATPNDYELLTLRGDSYFGLQDFEAAILDFTLAYQANPNTSYPLVRIGDIYQQTFDIGLAIDSYTQAITNDPNFSYAYIKRGIAYRKLGDSVRAEPDSLLYQLSIDDFNTAINLDGSSALAFARRSELFLSLRNFDQARADAQTAIAIGSQFAFAHTVLANLDKGTGRFNNAFASIQTALATPSENRGAYAYAYTMAAEMCWRLGQRTQAFTLIKQSQQYDETFATTDIVIARMLLDDQMAYTVSTDIPAGIRASGSTFAYMAHLAESWLFYNLYERTIIETYILAAEHNPTNPFVFDQLRYMPVEQTRYQRPARIYEEWRSLAFLLDPALQETDDEASG